MSRVDQQVNIRLPVETVEGLKQIAAANNVSLTEQVTALLEQFVVECGELVQFKLRLPKPIHGTLAGIAKAGSRSLNAEIVRRLAQSLAAGDKP